MPVILVVNKTDRGDARIAQVVDETYELFMLQYVLFDGKFRGIFSIMTSV